MNLLPLLQTTFGFPAFRENQEAVCNAVTEGRDVLLVMPTGAGKSLCYQLPTIARRRAGHGSTGLVISPLIALMEDQTAKLAAAGLRVARIHSGLSRDEARQSCREYLQGELQFLFIAPERMRVPGFPEMLARRTPSLVAVDEAHCISGWGHDFRPDYRALGDYLPLLRGESSSPTPIIALTATATTTVQQDIVSQLALREPALFIHGFRRENLAIEVVELSKPRRSDFIANFLTPPAARPGIVYAPSRKEAEALAMELGQRFPAAAYHAGLDPATRDRVQREFLAGTLEVVVATIAFGMGIDKPDIRTVIHAALPGSLEGYYQEIGRAGRDGRPSRVVLLHSWADRKIHESFFERDYPPVEDLARVARLLTDEFQEPEPLWQKLQMLPDTFGRAVEKLASQGAAQFDIEGRVRTLVRSTEAGRWRSGYQQQLAHRKAQLDRMAEFAETPQCRMSALVRHFGDTAGASRPCGHCDFCSPESAAAQPFAEPTEQQERDLRRILRELRQSGSKSTGRLFTETGGRASLPAARREFDGLLDGLARAGLVSFATETWNNPEGREVTFKKVSLTYEGRTLGEDEPLSVLLRQSADTAPSAGKRARGKAKPVRPKAGEPAPAFTPAQTELETRLREWRRAEAGRLSLPAYMILSDAALQALVLASPASIAQLQEVYGIGPSKTERWGAAIVALCSGREIPA
jgi:ATP-dependent DNA helicase RecQ